MPSGSFSRPVVVQEWPSRHCFISLPRTWASHVLSAATPTFNIEFSDGRSLLLSWAGDLHTPIPGEENQVLISREMMRNSGISNGDLGMINQVQGPSVCSSVTVIVGSLTEWQDLALNADAAQSSVLSQVRVISMGQTLPLWLEGGVLITLTVTNIVPENKFGILQPLTQVEVVPPIDQEESESFCPLNFDPTDAEVIENCVHKEEFSEIPDQVGCDKNHINKDVQSSYDHTSFELFMNYIAFKLKQGKILAETKVRKDLCLGYTVLPMPCSDDTQHSSFFIDHPNLVVVSKKSLLNLECQNEISFVSRITKVDSPRDKLEKAVAHRDEEKVTDTNQSISNSRTNQSHRSECKYCTVIVWENFVKSKIKDFEFVSEMSAILKENYCVISDTLRRFMKLEVSSIVRLDTRDVSVKTLPMAIDVSPLNSKDNLSCGILCDTIKRVLKDFVDEAVLVINCISLLCIKVDNKIIDVLITVRDKVPLKLSRESVALLNVTHVSNPSNVTHILSSVTDLEARFVPKYSYVGNKKVILDLKEHILLGLGFLLNQFKGVPQFALLCGGKGSGKSSLIETLVQCLSSRPYFLHFEVVRFKSLKGKKMETVEKKLQSIFREAIFRRRSVIVLEDIDSLVPSTGLENQESGQLQDFTMKMVTMLKSLLDSLLAFCVSDDISPHMNKKGSVMVIATAAMRTSVHHLIASPQGRHYFPCSFEIPPLEPGDRVNAFNSMIETYLGNISVDNSSVFYECCTSECEIKKSSLKKKNCMERNLTLKLTENFVLPDLNHLAFRTYFVARGRWKRNMCQSNCCKKCGNVIKKEHEKGESSVIPVSESNYDLEEMSILNEDLQAAHKGYIPLALRGLDIVAKKTSGILEVGGLSDARKTLKETLTWPSIFPNLFNKVKLRLRSGVLLYGPPGCGKTLIANSIAVNCQLNFISVKGPELLSKYIGASEQAVRDAFERATSAKPCILFFDEFESIAPRRGHDSTGVTDRVVNQLLTQMDGVEGLSGVYILAATSRPDLIDPALLRPGRLDKCVFCPMPTLADREDILNILCKNIEVGEEINWSEIAGATENYSGADLQSILSTAQILVAQEAVGKTLYDGVIQSDKTKDKRSFLDQDIDEQANKNMNSETEKTLVQVAVEKEKVKFTTRKRDREDSSINTKDTADLSEPACNLESNIDYEEKLEGGAQFRVCKRHIIDSLKEVKPSVTASERLKYEKLYSSFNKSRDGNFGKQTPGKRSTLA